MVPSKLLSGIRDQARSRRKTVVLPDALDERMLKAARVITDEGIAQAVLVGSESEIRGLAASGNVVIDGIRIVDPARSERQSDFARAFFHLRKEKGLQFEEAAAIIKQPLFFGAMMVREGMADGSVAGSLSTTGDVLRAAIQVIGLKQGLSIVSSFFLMVFPHKVFSFADSAVVPDPDAAQLADIAIATAANHQKLTQEEPRVAMLSFSTRGSANHPLVEKVRQATAILKSKAPHLIADGELQLDAAVVPQIARSKAPGSPVEGQANVLIFPDLNAGNIAYKLAQRLGGAEAIGPIVQGLNKPAFDVSRGCSVDDIVNTVAINCVLAG